MNWSWLKFSRQQLKSYGLDWAVIIFATLVGIAIGFIKPQQSQFSVLDKSISYPLIPKQTLSGAIAIGISVSIPTIIILIWSVAQSNGRSFHHGVLGLLLSNSLALLLVQIFKVGVGRLRPDFLARCQPELTDYVEKLGTLSNFSICMQTDIKMIYDGQKSFFSGHAATAFASFGFLSLFLAGKLQVCDGRGHTYKLFIVLVPLLIASYISITRLHDHRHHTTDVLCGALVGSLFAFISYFQYFPSLFICNDLPLPCRLTTEMMLKERRNSILTPKANTLNSTYKPQC